MTNDNKDYTLMKVREFTKFDRKSMKKDKQLIETDTTTKIIIKTYMVEE